MSVNYMREFRARRRKASGKARGERNVSWKRHLGLECLEARQLLAADVGLAESYEWLVSDKVEDKSIEEAWAVPAETLLSSDEAPRKSLMAWEEVPMAGDTAEPMLFTFAAADSEVVPVMLMAEMVEGVPVAATEELEVIDDAIWEKPFAETLDGAADGRIYMMTMMSADARLDGGLGSVDEAPLLAASGEVWALDEGLLEVATTEFDTSEIKRSLILEASADLGDARAWDVDDGEIVILMDSVGTEEAVTFEATTFDETVSVLADTDVFDDVPIRMTRTGTSLDEPADDDVILYATMDPPDEIVELMSTSVSPWQNPDNPNDVNNDGIVTPLDLLIVINQLNTRTDLSASPLTVAVSAIFVDVDGDFLLDAGDALRITNALNSATVYETPAIEASRLAPAWFSDADSGDGWLDDTAEDSLLLEEPLADNEVSVFSDEVDWLLPELI